MAQKPKNIGAIQKAFLLQANRNKEDEQKVSVDVPKEPSSNWLKEKKILEDKIKAVEYEKQQIQAKYEKLKSKHFGLLQTLLNLEEKNQNLELKLGSMKTLHAEFDIEPKTDGLAAPASPSFEIDLLANLVNILLIII